ncbi:LysM peptidoglycan-binding domain-containing protein [Metabacillus fastidiosus]|uniref:LysM peptidoglycan-binding domain-containing protein n=1 Tax=Metabacillus fastidiosus TaxID=1458 RepID=UPI003D2B63F9
MKSIVFTITIKNNRTGNYMQLPVLPIDGKITDTKGETQAISEEIINLGSVDFPSGDNLDSISFYTFFPARFDRGYCVTSSLKAPLEYVRIFESWKARKESLQIIIPAANINKTMYVKGFTPEHGIGAEGDVYYTVDFQEYKTVKAQKIKKNTTTVSKKPTAAKRSAAPKKPTPKYYVVKKGDWLIKIAKSHKIKDWRKQLYEPNKKPKGPLGPNPDLIYPGQKIKLP